MLLNFFMYSHVEMIVILYLNFFCIRNMLPKGVRLCLRGCMKEDQGRVASNHTSIHA
jgi:hypothetical protein